MCFLLFSVDFLANKEKKSLFHFYILQKSFIQPSADFFTFLLHWIQCIWSHAEFLVKASHFEIGMASLLLVSLVFSMLLSICLEHDTLGI